MIPGSYTTLKGSKRFHEMRGNSDLAPEASVIIPVNAEADLTTVRAALEDLSRYQGQRLVEVILVVNNYDPGAPPGLGHFREEGIRVISVPTVRRPSEVVIVSARALGVEAARSSVTIHFDADCRIHHATALIDWYAKILEGNKGVAYTHVGFYQLRPRLAVRTKILIHNLSRWIKRELMGVPTTRGSNYAIDRSLFLQLYRSHQLSVDLQIGPAAKLAGAAVAYSGRPELSVLTSGRRFRGGWFRMIPYYFYRLRYNLMAIPTRWRPVTASSWSGFDRESDNRQ